jgi:hypothetical protein
VPSVKTLNQEHDVSHITGRALGVAMASVISSAEAAPAVAQLALFPLLFVSGMYMPIHSALLSRSSGWLPVRPFNEELTGPFAEHAGRRLAAPRSPGRPGPRRRAGGGPALPLGTHAQVAANALVRGPRR